MKKVTPKKEKSVVGTTKEPEEKKPEEKKPEDKKPKTHRLEDVIKAKNKSCGPGTMFLGSGLRYNPPRLPIGVFAVDFISSGGLPMHGSTCFWGGETGAKTFLAIKTMNQVGRICWKCFNQKKFCTCGQEPLEMKTSWIDVEGTLDREWIDACGPDHDKYIVTLADNAEEAIDCADASLQAEDCGLVVLDSLGALVPEREMENNADASNMGVGPSVVTRAVKKLKQRMIRERKREHPCAVVFVNQMRKKLNIQFGSKDGQPGGHAMMHEFSLLFRCGKETMKKDGADGKYYAPDRERHMASRHTCSIYKEKVFILARSAKFVLVKENIPLFGLKKGVVSDFADVIKYAKEYGFLTDTGGKNKYQILEPEKIGFGTQTEMKAYFMQNQDTYFQLQKLIVDEAAKRVKGRK